MRMRKNFTRFLLLFLGPLFCLSVAAGAQTTLRVAAAADLEPVLPPILDQFRQATGIHAEATFQASAVLTTQIENGAPFDLFLSADTGYPKRLIDAEGLGGAMEMVERGVAFAEGNGVAEAVENGQQFSEPPYAGIVDSLERSAPLAPEPLQGAGIGAVIALSLQPSGIFDLKQVAAFDAAKIGLRLRARDLRAASKTAELMQIVVHAWC